MPSVLLARLDKLAETQGTTRAKVVIDACRAYLDGSVAQPAEQRPHKPQDEGSIPSGATNPLAIPGVFLGSQLSSNPEPSDAPETVQMCPFVERDYDSGRRMQCGYQLHSNKKPHGDWYEVPSND